MIDDPRTTGERVLSRKSHLHPIAFIIAGLVTLVGLRLAARSLVRRAAPEFTLGVAVTLLQPGIVLAGYALETSRSELYGVSLACITAGTATIALFAQLTFRARVGWARAVIALLIAFLCYGHMLQLPRMMATGQPHLLYLSGRLLLLGWAAFEALRHRAVYARRERIGMFNPVIANRFLLFGIWTSLMALNAVGTMLIVVLGESFGLLDWRTWNFGVARGISSFLLIAMWLIFFPPRSYLAWLERRYAERTRRAGATS
jgi:hypothetical protein